MIILFCIYIALGLKIEPLNWIIYIFNLQGLEIYVHGAEHLWYLTIAMVCYFITPILDKNKYKLNKQKLIVFFVVYVVFQLIMSYFIHEQFGRYLILIGLYIVSYLISFYWNSKSIDFKMFILYCIGLIFAFAFRILGIIMFDGNILYDILIVGYTHSLLGLSIFFIGFYIVKQFKLNILFSFAKKFDAISYEIYLVHYMFIVGPVSVLFTDSSIINCFFVLIASIVSALVLNKISTIIKKYI